MSNWYQNVMLTIIAILLGAVVAKLYLPAANRIGPQIAVPTRGDFIEARKLRDRGELEQLRSRTPVVWISGGSIEADVTNTVSISGEVSIQQRQELDRDAINRYFSEQ